MLSSSILIIIISYKNLIIHAILSLSIALILTAFNLSTRFLEGLHTYIHPENLGNQRDQSNLRAAIRRPETPSQENPEPKRRTTRSKDKFEFDETNAQIFRLRLVDGHLQSRLYFSQFRFAFVCSTVALSNLLLRAFLSVPEQDAGLFGDGSAIPIVFGFYTVCKVSVFLAKVSFERSASRRSEKHVSILLAFLGFLLVVSIASVFSPSVFDFDLDSVDGVSMVLIAACAGCVAGFLYMPATKIARSFWLGTDQLRWKMSVISCGTVARMLLYSNFLMIVFTSLLWINPVAEILVNNNSSGASSNSNRRMGFSGNVGMSRLDFVNFRVWCLMVSGILQLLTLRPNLQMYLNEAVLSWYQRLHASKVPDLDFSRAKIFLHNYYLCLVVLQFFLPPVLLLLFLGLSQIQGNLFGGFPIIYSFEHCSSFLKEVSLFLAWWIVFVSAIFTSSSLALYRCGILLIS